jgi:hypothetical protein
VGGDLAGILEEFKRKEKRKVRLRIIIPMEDSDLEDYDRLHIQPMDYLLGYYISIADKYE